MSIRNEQFCANELNFYIEIFKNSEYNMSINIKGDNIK